MKTILYWFSGTGNSRAMAQDVAAELGDAAIVPVVTAMSGSMETADRVGLFFPVYGFGIPGIIGDFVRKMPITASTYFFTVATMGGTAGASHRQVRRIVRGRGGDLMAGWSVQMPGNYTPLYGAPPDATQHKQFLAARARAKTIAQAVMAGARGPFEDSMPPLSWIGLLLNRVSVKSFRVADRKFRVEQSCTHCGICAKVCPVANIVMKAGAPVWQNRCEQCLACLQWCPVEAIQSGRSTKGRRRYRHPKYTASDFFLRG